MTDAPTPDDTPAEADDVGAGCLVLTKNEQLAIVNGKISALEQRRWNQQLEIAVAPENRRGAMGKAVDELTTSIAALAPLRQELLDGGADAEGIQTSPGSLRRAARGLPG